MDDALVIVSGAEAIAAVEAVARVRQRYGDRVVVVPATAVPQLRGMAQAAVFVAGETVAEAPPDLNETERMGVAAWNARLADRGKPRPGDGLAWDTPGFEAP